MTESDPPGEILVSLFPLTGSLLLPGTFLPLNVFEPRYRALVADALEGDRRIGMIQPRLPGRDNSGWHPGDPERPELYAVGCVGELAECEPQPDGRYLIVLAGLGRFRIVRELDEERPYRRAVADRREFRTDGAEASAELDKDAVLAAVDRYRARHEIAFDMDAGGTARRPPGQRPERGTAVRRAREASPARGVDGRDPPRPAAGADGDGGRAGRLPRPLLAADGPLMAALRPLPMPPDAPARWTTAAFPPYRHVPGLTPHPVTDPGGHSHGARDPVADLSGLSLPADWRRCEEYLRGVDLFNAAYLWEAHEAWEAVWHAVGHDTPVGRFLQGLIQAAAALLQHHRGTRVGHHRLRTRAVALLEALPPGPDGRALGVPVAAWLAAVHRRLDADGPYPFLRLG
ncbi:MAG: DUF309 domain-containing protein [Thermoanaerobaculia bacterium]